MTHHYWCVLSGTLRFKRSAQIGNPPRLPNDNYFAMIPFPTARAVLGLGLGLVTILKSVLVGHTSCACSRAIFPFHTIRSCRGLTAIVNRSFYVVIPLLTTTLCLCARVVPFLAVRSYPEPTMIDKRLVND